MRPNDEQIGLARKIADAYQASGIPANSHQGRVVVERDEEWEGPFDPHELQTIYLDEIARLEQSVRTAVAECYDQWEVEHPNYGPRSIVPRVDDLPEDRKKDIWLQCDLSSEKLVPLGLSEHKARLYLNVARMLHYRKDLWR